MAYPVRRFSPEELAAADGVVLDDLVGPGLDVLLVGINPGRQSGAKRLHFGNPSNRLWGALHVAGLTPRRFAPEEADELLGRGIGIINMVMRTTKGEEHLQPWEFRDGAAVLAEKVRRLRPRAVVILGKGAYEKGFQRRVESFGRQTESLSGIPMWVLPNPSPRNATYSPSFFAAEFDKIRIALGLPDARGEA